MQQPAEVCGWNINVQTAGSSCHMTSYSAFFPNPVSSTQVTCAVQIKYMCTHALLAVQIEMAALSGKDQPILISHAETTKALSNTSFTQLSGKTADIRIYLLSHATRRQKSTCERSWFCNWIMSPEYNSGLSRPHLLNVSVYYITVTHTLTSETSLVLIKKR